MNVHNFVSVYRDVLYMQLFLCLCVTSCFICFLCRKKRVLTDAARPGARPSVWTCVSMRVWLSLSVYFYTSVCLWLSVSLAVWVWRSYKDEGRRSAVSPDCRGGWSHSVCPQHPGRLRSFRTLKEQCILPTSTSTASPAEGLLPPHVHKAHRDQERLQVCEHDRVLPDLCGGDHRQLNAPQDHIQEQVYEEWTQCPDWQPGTRRPALYHHCHPHKCV